MARSSIALTIVAASASTPRSRLMTPCAPPGWLGARCAVTVTFIAALRSRSACGSNPAMIAEAWANSGACTHQSSGFRLATRSK